MLTVLMATRNGAETLTQVLDAYCHLLAPVGGWRLLVVDNGSQDATPAILASYRDRLPLQCMHEPAAGKNRALNRAIDLALAQSADDELFIFTDDDATPAANWLQQWQICARRNLDDSVFGGAISADWAEAPPDWLLKLVPTGLTYGLTAPDLADGPVFPGLVWGANMAVRPAVFAAGHRFDVDVGPNGPDYAMGSETELTRRLGQAGYRSWFFPAAEVRHRIRKPQIQVGYILQKAWRYGRGKYRQEHPGVFVELWGIPRWMWTRALSELAGLSMALLQRDVGRVFRHRWELAYLRGYFYEARNGVSCKRSTVLVTSYSGELGGMELRMAQEARYLQSAGHRVTLALRHFDGWKDWTQRLTAEQIAVAAFDPPAFFEQDWRWRHLRVWRARWIAASRLRGFQADLAHIALCWTNYGASVLWLASHCRLPAVISVHNAFPAVRFDAWHDKLLKQAFAGVRGVYAVSASALEHFKDIYRPYLLASTRLAVIPNGVDVDQFRPSLALRLQARQRLKLPQDALVIGAVARLSEQKRPDLLLKLFAILCKRFPELYLVLAGSGPLESALRAQAARLEILPRVIFTGFVNEISTLMPALDVHVLMSRREGFGLATIEAMACGIPAVATDVPGSADILRGSLGGMLVPVNDVDVAADMVAGLLADPARRADMGRQGRREAEALYSHRVVGQQVRAFYEGLL